MTGVDISVTTLSTLRTDSGACWDALDSSAGFYGSRQWLALSEDDPDVDVGYLVAHDRSGRVLGGLATFAPLRESNSFYDPAQVLPGGWTTPAPSEVLLLGGRRGYRSDCALAPGLGTEEQLATRTALLTAASSRAAESGRRALFLYCPEPARSALIAAGAGAGALLNADATLPLPGTRFEDWLATLRPNRRSAVKREMRAFREAGWTTDLRPVSHILPAAGRLATNVQRRYGHPADDDTMAGKIESQHAALGAVEVTFVAARGTAMGEELGGYCLAYRHGRTLYIREAGFDYDISPGFAYFNLVYYEPMQYAYEHGYSRLHLGIEALQAKVNRGADLTGLWCLPVGWNLPRGVVDAAALALRARLVEALDVGPDLPGL